MENVDLLGPFREFVATQKLVSPQDRVLVAVSGGMDSMALMDLFTRFFQGERDRWGVIYVNHGWDAKRHEKEEALVRDFAHNCSVPIHIKKIELTQEESRKGMSLESWARQERYRLFSEVMREGGYKRCATGHTLDDQAETVLMRLLQGSGMWGLSGIPVQRGAFIRPLLGFYREDIEKYVSMRHIPYLDDPTNLERRFYRARVRHELLPFLELKYNPKVKKALVELANDMTGWRTDIIKILPSPIAREKGKILLAESEFFSYLDILRKFWLQEALQEAAGELYPLRRNHLKQVSRLSGEGKTGKWVQLPGGIRLLRDREHLVVLKASEYSAETVEISPGIHRIPSLGVVFQAEEAALQDVDYGTTGWVEWMDGDKLPLPWVLRKWHRGDRFRPLGLGFMFRDSRHSCSAQTYRKFSLPEPFPSHREPEPHQHLEVPRKPLSLPFPTFFDPPADSTPSR